jgi:hypothetical protein
MPTRGLLITTRIMVRTERRECIGRPAWGILFQPNPDVSITGGLEWTTGPILDRAKKVALAHQGWIRNRPSYVAIADLDAIRKVQLNSFATQPAKPSGSYDYFTEAASHLDSVDLLAASSGRNLDGRITEYLDRVQSRVSQRRRRNGMNSAPEDPCWRDKAREAIRARISQLQRRP